MPWQSTHREDGMALRECCNRKSAADSLPNTQSLLITGNVARPGAFTQGVIRTPCRPASLPAAAPSVMMPQTHPCNALLPPTHSLPQNIPTPSHLSR